MELWTNLLCFKVQILFFPNVFVVERISASLKSRSREGTVCDNIMLSYRFYETKRKRNDLLVMCINSDTMVSGSVSSLYSVMSHGGGN